MEATLSRAGLVWMRHCDLFQQGMLMNHPLRPPAAQSVQQSWWPAAYFVLGQAGWFACVVGAARAQPGVGVGVVLLLLGLHLWRARRPREELKLIVIVMLLGGVWESLLINLGLLVYSGSDLASHVAPLWLLALWGLLAAQLNSTYRWLRARPLVAALLGAVAGPLSFRAGAALGALRFAQPGMALLALALGWAALLPLVTRLAQRYDGINVAMPSAAAAPLRA